MMRAIVSTSHEGRGSKFLEAEVCLQKKNESESVSGFVSVEFVYENVYAFLE